MALDVETLERATVDVVAPLRVEELPGWLVPLDPGEVNRANSAVPLQHAVQTPDVLAPILEHYRAHGLAPQFRLADVPGLSALQRALAALSFEPRRPTYMQLASASACVPAGEVSLAAAPDAAFYHVFHGGTAAQASPLERPRRSPRVASTLYATLRAEGAPVAVGALTFARGLACVHSMRTHDAQRGRGHGRQVLGALVEAAHARGMSHVFLQVEEDNAAARALYTKLGFTTLWRYRYWRR